MTIEKRVKLHNNIYYVVLDVEYKKKDSKVCLCLSNKKEDYYDGGDLTNLIEKIEQDYTSEKAQKYQKDIGFLQDAFYIYDRIPILSGIKDIYQKKKESLPYSQSYISKKELDDLIEQNNIQMSNHKNFKLYDKQTWVS